jgi:acyl-CoA thioesterase I
MKNLPLITNLYSTLRSLTPFDTPAKRATQGERLLNPAPTPFVLITSHLATVLGLPSGMASSFISALRSKVYRSMSEVGAATLKLALLFIALVLPCSAHAAKNILVFGDSLSAGYGLAIEKSWVHLLQQELQRTQPGFSVVNASISGETTTGGRERIAAALQQFRPAIVIVELGANDGLRGAPVRDMEANLGDIIEKSRGSGAKVLLLGMKLPPNYGGPYTAQFARVYPRLAKKHRIPLLPFLLEGVPADQFQADNLHPAAVAQPHIMQNVLQQLKPLLH